MKDYAGVEVSIVASGARRSAAGRLARAGIVALGAAIVLAGCFGGEPEQEPVKTVSASKREEPLASPISPLSWTNSSLSAVADWAVSLFGPSGDSTESEDGSAGKPAEHVKPAKSVSPVSDEFDIEEERKPVEYRVQLIELQGSASAAHARVPRR